MQAVIIQDAKFSRPKSKVSLSPAPTTATPKSQLATGGERAALNKTINRGVSTDNSKRAALSPPELSLGQSLAVRNALVEKNIGLVRQVAHVYAKHCHEPYADLEQQGVLGLIRALDRFDPSRAALSSFAIPYIRGTILHYLRDQGHLIKVPRAWQEQYQAVKRRQRQMHPLTRSSDLKSQYQCLDTVARHMNIDSQTWGHIRRAMTGWVLPINEEIAENLSGAEHWEHSLEYEELYEAIKELQDEKRACVEMVFFEQLSHRQTAKKLGVTTKQVTLILQSAIAQLTEKLNSDVP